MKTITFLIIFLPTLFYSQQDTIVWDNSKHSDSTNRKWKDGYYIFKRADVKTSEGILKDNRSSGRWKCYYDNGKVQSLIDYVPFQNRSCYNGLYKEFYKSGKTKLDGNYQFLDSLECVNCFDVVTKNKIYKAELNPSIKVGTWKEYWDNGQLKSSGQYYKGVHQTNYSSLPNPKSYGVFTPGGLTDEYLKDGEWKHYNEKGELISIEFYLKGSLVSVQN